MKIVHLLESDIVNDSRVIKELNSLSEFFSSYSFYLCSLCTNKEKYENILPKVKHLELTKNKSIFSNVRYIRFLMYFIDLTIQLFNKVKQINPDIIHCHDIKPLLASVLYKVSNPHVKIIFDSHEYQSEVKSANFFRKILIKTCERIYLTKVDHVICVSEGISGEYSRLYNIKRPTVVLNTPKLRTSEPTNILRESLNLDSQNKLFLYQGGLSKGRGLKEMISLFLNDSLKDSYLVVLGNGPLKDELKQMANKASNIHFLDAVDQDKLLSYTSSADYGILLYENICLNHYYCLPNKLFEYLQAGIPMILSDLFELNKFINTHNTGVNINPYEIDKNAKLLANLSKSDLEAFKQNIKTTQPLYTWEREEKKLFSIYKSLV